MIYVQIKVGQKLHLAYQPGEGFADSIVKSGYLSNPLCGRSVGGSGYRMNINVPLGNACKNCQRIFNSRSTK